MRNKNCNTRNNTKKSEINTNIIANINSGTNTNNESCLKEFFDNIPKPKLVFKLEKNACYEFSWLTDLKLLNIRPFLFFKVQICDPYHT